MIIGVMCSQATEKAAQLGLLLIMQIKIWGIPANWFSKKPTRHGPIGHKSASKIDIRTNASLRILISDRGSMILRVSDWKQNVLNTAHLKKSRKICLIFTVFLFFSFFLSLYPNGTSRGLITSDWSMILKLKWKSRHSRLAWCWIWHSGKHCRLYDVIQKRRHKPLLCGV